MGAGPHAFNNTSEVRHGDIICSRIFSQEERKGREAEEEEEWERNRSGKGVKKEGRSGKGMK